MEKCPCQSNLNYEKCCQPLIEGDSQAETAEQLMRSRYTAHATKNIPYILKTVHPKRRHEHKKETIQQRLKNTDWMGLEIVNTEGGQKSDEAGIVEFVAEFSVHGVPGKHREVSTFEQHNDIWYFVKGDAQTDNEKQIPVKKDPKVGRNDPCPCGSGKKYKKCCA